MHPNLLQLLTEYLPLCRKQDMGHGIARTMLDHPDELPTMKIEALARLAHTTHPSVTKLCRQLGFAGWTDLREMPEGTVALPVDAGPSPHHAIVGLRPGHLMADISARLDTPQVATVARRMAHARMTAVVTGVYGFMAAGLFMEQMHGLGLRVPQPTAPQSLR